MEKEQGNIQSDSKFPPMFSLANLVFLLSEAQFWVSVPADVCDLLTRSPGHMALVSQLLVRDTDHFLSASAIEKVTFP